MQSNIYVHNDPEFQLPEIKKDLTKDAAPWFGNCSYWKRYPDLKKSIFDDA